MSSYLKDQVFNLTTFPISLTFTETDDFYNETSSSFKVMNQKVDNQFQYAHKHEFMNNPNKSSPVLGLEQHFEMHFGCGGGNITVQDNFHT